MALDLLGVPVALRAGSMLLEPPAGADPVEHLKALADDEIARLSELQEGVLAEVDAAEREAAIAGRYDDAELKRLRRYESSCTARDARRRGACPRTGAGRGLPGLLGGNTAASLDAPSRRGRPPGSRSR